MIPFWPSTTEAENLEKESNAEEVVVEIEDILGGDKTTALDVSNDLLSVL